MIYIYIYVYVIYIYIYTHTHIHTYTHTQSGILLSHKKNKIMPFAATWMDLEIIILSEVRERQIILYDIRYMWNLKYDTNELIYKTEIESQTKKINLWLPKGKQGRDKLGVCD